jgi:TonB family protein
MRYGFRLFEEANLNPHYRPFRGIALSLVVHASLLTGLITIPLLFAADERPRFEEAVILDADDLKDALYLPLLGGEKPPHTARNSEPAEIQPPAPIKEGLSYPGPQPILSKFPVPTNHTQTILQPALKDPLHLDLAIPLPNIVRLPAPEVLRKLTVPNAPPLPLQPPPLLAARPALPLTDPSQPLAAPSVDSKLNVLEPVTPLARPSTPLMARFDAPSEPIGPLAAPRHESGLKVLDPVTSVARPSQASVGQLDPTVSAPTRPLAAPLAESKLRIPEDSTVIARPALPVRPGEPSLAVSALGRPLAAPLAESKIKVLDPATPEAQPARSTQITPLGVPTTSDPSRPLAAPVAESKLKVADSTTAETQLARPTQVAPLNIPMAGPSRPLAAPLAESRIKITDTATPATRPSPQAAVPKLDVPLTVPTRPLAAPIAESKIRVPDSTSPVARQATPAILPLDLPQTANQPLVALSPMPARRDQPVTIPAGEARGEFAISPQPNLTFPGTEPGGKPSTANATASNAAGGVATSNKTTSTATSTAPAGSGITTLGAGAGAFPGITILGAETASSTPSRNTTPNSSAQSKSVPPPLQTSYGITILASGGSGGGLPDFGVFANEQVHTAYLDMRRTIQDEPISWTVEFGVKQPEATAASERVATVGSQQEVILPFPIDKERPAIPADLVRRHSGRLMIAYAVVTPDGKMEQLSIKQSPDPALNEIVLSALQKWTFRPARRNGEVISAKILLGIPVRTY